MFTYGGTRSAVQRSCERLFYGLFRAPLSSLVRDRSTLSQGFTTSQQLARCSIIQYITECVVTGPLLCVVVMQNLCISLHYRRRVMHCNPFVRLSICPTMARLTDDAFFEVKLRTIEGWKLKSRVRFQLQHIVPTRVKNRIGKIFSKY